MVTKIKLTKMEVIEIVERYIAKKLDKDYYIMSTEINPKIEGEHEVGYFVVDYEEEPVDEEDDFDYETDVDIEDEDGEDEEEEEELAQCGNCGGSNLLSEEKSSDSHGVFQMW